MPHTIKYDFIIAGMGCAGLSFAMQLKQSKVSFTKVLLIDKDLKTKNDRTWCFWTKDQHKWYDKIVFRSWDKFNFKSKNYSKDFVLHPYKYQMIRGIDFYSYCLAELKKDERFLIIHEPITELATINGVGLLRTKEHTYFSKHIFNSAFRIQSIQSHHVNYIQHFKGWLIETKEACFDDACPVFMNFDTEQDNDCRFFYLIPFSKNKALIEYTGFSKHKLSDEAYDEKLADYIKNDLKIVSYTLLETEKGEIPMAESAFINPFGEAVTNIGTAGGYSKPSTGYTFYFIQKNAEHLIAQLEKNTNLISPVKRKWDHELYDKILLDVLNKKQIAARDVFTFLFKKNKISTLLAFLNEESTLMQDLRILNSVPKKQFIFSALKKLIR